MSHTALQELVESYCNNPSPRLLNSIVSNSIPLIRSIIAKINSPDQLMAKQEDLESVAVSGLIQALNKYDCSKDAQFSTFAYYRIHGSVVDHLREIDRIPRGVRENNGLAQDVIQVKSQELGRAPNDNEVADALDMSLGEYRKLQTNVRQRNLTSLDCIGDDDTKTYYDFLPDPESVMPDHNIECEQVTDCLMKKIGELKERNRLILMLYYYENKNMKEIAVLVGLSGARVSQILRKLLRNLKRELKQEEVFQEM